MRQRNASILRDVRSCFRKRGAAEGFPRLKTEDGTNLVEFAWAFLLLVTILFGICEFGTVLYTYHFVSHAAKSAARWAAVNGSTCASDSSCTGAADSTAIGSYVKSIAPSGINTSNPPLTTTASWPSTSTACTGSWSSSNTTGTPAQNNPGCTVEVTVSYQYSFMFQLVSSKPLTLSSTSEMTIAH
jgi:Flp pilus assembly protein TadG